MGSRKLRMKEKIAIRKKRIILGLIFFLFIGFIGFELLGLSEKGFGQVIKANQPHEVERKQINQEMKKQESLNQVKENEEQTQDDEKEDVKHESTALEIGKVVYLTFDDGPGPKVMELLDLLHTYDAKATFFMLEPNMPLYTEAMQRMSEEGHALGVHSVTHDVSKVYASPASFVGEMQTAIDRIAEITDVQTSLIRAPYGSKPYLTEAFLTEINKKNMIYWDWNIDSLDWKKTDGSFVSHTIDQIEQLVGKEPLVILMHERTTTVNHIEQLLIYLQENDYEMRVLHEQMQPMQF